MHRISVVRLTQSLVRQGKREKETKFSFSLLNLSSFLSVVRRFPLESYTDMSLPLVYGLVDVSVLHAFGKYDSVKDFMRCTKAFTF